MVCPEDQREIDFDLAARTMRTVCRRVIIESSRKGLVKLLWIKAFFISDRMEIILGDK